MLCSCRRLYQPRACLRTVRASWPLTLPFHSARTAFRLGRDQARPLLVVAAKKGKGGGKKGGGGQKKGPGSLADIPKPPEPWKDPEVIMENLLLVESFRRKVGRPLLEGELEIQEIAETLWKAPMAILSSNDGDSEGEPPVFRYANEAALTLMGFDKLEDMIGAPSQARTDDSAEAQAGRERLMAEMLEKGFLDVQTPLKRHTLQGQPIQAQEATLWAVEAPTGELLGSAIAMWRWVGADGKERGPRAAPSEEAQESPDQSSAEPSEQLAAAEAAAAEQAQAVRELKEGKGLDNSSSEVQAAVDELLKRKAAVDKLKQ
ncbi:hypothetical protein WJX74_004619 [Apatococcus lobatus]|uniref:WHEP-TRS domain-containing protein n=1 Tax=Apatococcus lobatus TaxID=904363 RepID=A0AAW1QB84_9CHLO